jgi:hypothetical protein
MMGNQQQTQRAAAIEAQQIRTHDGAVREIQARMRLRDVLRELVAHNVEHADRHLLIVDDFLKPAGFACAKAQPQRVVPSHRVPQRLTQQLRVEVRRHVEQHGLVVLIRIGLALREEALLDRRQRQRAGRRDELRGGRCAERGHGGELGDGRMLEHQPRRDLQAGPGRQRHDAHAEDRIAAEREEVVVDAGRGDAERFGPDAAQQRLGARAGRRRRVGDGGPPRPVRRGQRLAVDLAVAAERQRVEHHVDAGNHVGRQRGGQRRGDLGVAERRAVAERDIRAQRGATVLVAIVERGRLADLRNRGQRVVDLPELDPVAADLQLVVAAAVQHQRAVGQIAADVARAVQAHAALRTEQVLDEHLARGGFVVQIAAPDRDARYAHFAGIPIGHRFIWASTTYRRTLRSGLPTGTYGVVGALVMRCCATSSDASAGP